MENHRRPQQDSVQSEAQAGVGENRNRRGIVNQHRADQPFRGGTLRIVAREPAGDTQRQQSRSANASHRQGGVGLQWRTKQKDRRARGKGQQGQTGARFDQSRQNEPGQNAEAHGFKGLMISPPFIGMVTTSVASRFIFMRSTMRIWLFS